MGYIRALFSLRVFRKSVYSGHMLTGSRGIQSIHPISVYMYHKNTHSDTETHSDTLVYSYRHIPANPTQITLPHSNRNTHIDRHTHTYITHSERHTHTLLDTYDLWDMKVRSRRTQTWIKGRYGELRTHQQKHITNTLNPNLRVWPPCLHFIILSHLYLLLFHTAYVLFIYMRGLTFLTYDMSDFLRDERRDERRELGTLFSRGVNTHFLVHLVLLSK